MILVKYYDYIENPLLFLKKYLDIINIFFIFFKIKEIKSKRKSVFKKNGKN